MSATIAAEPGVVTGRLEQASDELVEISVPDTDYRLHLVVAQPLQATVGDRVSGRISANARRVDVIAAGGRYVEPVIGRPRRIQGRIIGGDVSANTLIVDAAVPVTATLMPAQQASNFYIGQLVSFDVERGAAFEPI